MVEEFAVNEAEASADLLGEAAFGGVGEEASVVPRNVALAVEKNAKNNVLNNAYTAV